MQRLLNFYAWDCDGLRDDVRDMVVEAIGDEKTGVLIVDETGLDHYQVRGYTAWYRHITLSMAATAFLTILRRDTKKGDLHPVPIS